jgi:lysophospholipase L1-like esterase
VSVGGDATYGGAAVPAGITLIDGGSTIATYPNNAGSGPDPGVLPYWATFMGTGTIIRRATSGALLAQLETQQLISAMSDCVAAGVAPSEVDAVVCMIGENDANDSTESAAYAARLSQVFQVIERAFPNARVLIQDMRSEDAAYSEFGTIRAANAAVVAAGPTRVLVPYTGIALSDAVHYAYTADGYARAGALQVAAYQAAG